MPDAHLKALASAEPYPYWLDDVDEPDSTDTLVDADTADLCIVGGGYTGLWTAILAKERDPTRDVVVVEASTCGSAASGRNGGFLEASLTHGIANGMARFAQELPLLEKLGLENLDAIERFVTDHGIDCDWERPGVIDVAVSEAWMAHLRRTYYHLEALGQDVTLLDGDEMQAEVHSPTYAGGLWRHGRAALCDPARLAWGMKQVALDLGVRIFEDSKATSLREVGPAMEIRAGYGSVRAARVALATNAFPPLVRRIRSYVVPVYDYVLTTEPLTPDQREAVGWARRQGLSDTTNQFHYYRLTEDDRILWGGYDAIYYFGSKIGPHLEHRPETFVRLSENFFQTFPQLEGIRFSHAWGGAIDTCSRFTNYWGKAFGGKVAYTVGFTGLGAASTRFGARVMLDLLDKRDSLPTTLNFVRQKPLPFPPEPIRWAGIQLTRWSLDKADARGGSRNLWLRSLDRMGLGFDS
jgi:glycine/D-amino acid oxidase-like deaminating enzyme